MRQRVGRGTACFIGCDTEELAQQGAQVLDLEALATQGGPLLADNAGEAMTAAEAQTLSLLAGIDPDTLTPREALDALYKLKSVISS